MLGRYRIDELGVVIAVDGDPAGHDPGTVLAPAADLRSPMTVGRRWPVVGGQPSAAANTVAVRWLLRERAVVLEGPPARDLVAEVPASALRAEALGEARALAEAWDDDAPTVAWVCRVLHTAVTATVVRESDAVTWALGFVPLAPHREAIAAGLGSRAFAWDAALQAGEHALVAREDS